jgi:hypothetical protein
MAAHVIDITDVHAPSHIGYETGVPMIDASTLRSVRSPSSVPPIPRSVVRLGEREQTSDENDAFVTDEHDSHVPLRAESSLAAYSRAIQSNTHAIERELESMRRQLIELQQSHRSMSDIINTLVKSQRAERQKRVEMRKVMKTDARSLIHNATHSSQTVEKTDNHSEDSSLPVQTTQSPLNRAFPSRPPPRVGEPTNNDTAVIDEHKQEDHRQDANEDKKISCINNVPETADDNRIECIHIETETWCSSAPRPCCRHPHLRETQQAQCYHCGVRGHYTGECPHGSKDQSWNGHQAWAERNERMFERKGRTYLYVQQWWIKKSESIASLKAAKHSNTQRLLKIKSISRIDDMPNADMECMIDVDEE